MYKVKLMNKISSVGLDYFNEDYEYGETLENEDAILLRSASLHEYEFTKNVKAIARAGAGVNNIPVEKCSEKGIVVFNTPGANANAVKELVLCALFLSSRKIVESIEWVNTLKDDENVGKTAEKGKSNFVGPEIEGKKLGVIGLGAIGVLVANAANKLGMEVYGYDPLCLSILLGLYQNMYVKQKIWMKYLKHVTILLSMYQVLKIQRVC